MKSGNNLRPSSIQSSRTSGFTLVELSIVLVIIGLLVGGVLSGQSLIRAAEIRSVISDYNKYTAAIYTFKDKYMALPGDMNNATQFWGVAGGSGSEPPVGTQSAMMQKPATAMAMEKFLAPTQTITKNSVSCSISPMRD